MAFISCGDMSINFLGAKFKLELLLPYMPTLLLVPRFKCLLKIEDLVGDLKPTASLDCVRFSKACCYPSSSANDLVLGKMLIYSIIVSLLWPFLLKDTSLDAFTLYYLAGFLSVLEWCVFCFLCKAFWFRTCLSGDYILVISLCSSFSWAKWVKLF